MERILGLLCFFNVCYPDKKVCFDVHKDNGVKVQTCPVRKAVTIAFSQLTKLPVSWLFSYRIYRYINLL